MSLSTKHKHHNHRQASPEPDVAPLKGASHVKSVKSSHSHTTVTMKDFEHRCDEVIEHAERILQRTRSQEATLRGRLSQSPQRFSVSPQRPSDLVPPAPTTTPLPADTRERPAWRDVGASTPTAAVDLTPPKREESPSLLSRVRGSLGRLSGSPAPSPTKSAHGPASSPKKAAVVAATAAAQGKATPLATTPSFTAAPEAADRALGAVGETAAEKRPRSATPPRREESPSLLSRVRGSLGLLPGKTSRSPASSPQKAALKAGLKATSPAAKATAPAAEHRKSVTFDNVPAPADAAPADAAPASPKKGGRSTPKSRRHCAQLVDPAAPAGASTTLTPRHEAVVRFIRTHTIRRCLSVLRKDDLVHCLHGEGVKDVDRARLNRLLLKDARALIIIKRF